MPHLPELIQSLSRVFVADVKWLEDEEKKKRKAELLILCFVWEFGDHITGREMAERFCRHTSYKKRLQNCGLGNVKGRVCYTMYTRTDTRRDVWLK